MFWHTGKSVIVKAMASAMCVLSVGVASATVPAVVASNHQTLLTGITLGTYRIAANARGDIFYTTPNAVSTDYADSKLMELPAGSTTPITLLYDLWSPRAVDIDMYGNLYVNDQGAGHVILVPFVGGTYAQNVDAFSVVGTPSSVTPTQTAVVCTSLPKPGQSGSTTDCSMPTLGVLTGYYSQTVDTAMDAAGNYYFVDANDNVSAGKYNRIIKYSASGTISVLVDQLTNAYTAEIASDAAGNVYYVSSTSGLLMIPAGSTTATAMNASTLLKPTGVMIDAAGNLIVSDSGNSRLVVMPFENGAVNFADQYLLAPVYTPNGVGIDGFGTMYYATSNSASASILSEQTSIYHAGPLAVGASTTSALVYFSFNATTKVGGFSVSGNGAAVTTTGNTCPSSSATAITYTAGQSCSYNASIKPTRVGAVSAYVGLNDGAGNVVAQFTETAIGTGAAENIDPGTVAAIGTGFTTPEGVAVDRAGNVFVADTGASTVWELVGGAGTPVAIGSGFNKPTGVSVDLAGDLFVADTGNQRVVEVPLVNGVLSSASQMVVASSLLAPIVIANGPLSSLYVASSGVLSRYEVRGLLPPALSFTAPGIKIALPGSITVDNNGNVFIGDASAGVVAEFTAAQTLYTNDSTKFPQVNVVTGLSNPTGLATDAAGNLYVVDSATAQATRVPNTNGTLTSSGAFSVGTFGSPYGVALDSAGNLIVSDTTTGSPTVNRVTRTLGVLNFPYQNVGTTSSPLTSQIVSSGTTALVLGTPTYTATGDTTKFSLASSTCAAGQSLASAGTCNLTATFTPTTKATSQEVLALSAAPTVATPPFTLTLNGLGTVQVATTLAITKPTGTISYGQAVTLTAALTPASFNVANATGTVTFTINGQVQKPVTISGNAASITTSTLSGGDNSISAVYSGDINYSPSTASAVVVTLGTASTTTTLAITVPFNNPLSQTVGGNVVMTATVTASVAGSLSGNVNFISGGTVLGTAPAQLVSGTTYQAVLTTATIPAGNYSVYAEYVGNTNYTKSDSATQQLVITNAGILLTSNTYAVTATSGTPGVAALSLASIGGLGSLPNLAPVSLSCSGLPANAICRFTPGYLTTLIASTTANPVAPTADALQILVDYSDGTPLPPVASLRARSEVVFACLLGMPMLLAMRRRERKRMARALTLMAVLLVLPVTMAISGCSGGTNSTAVTPAGTYPIVVKAFVNGSVYSNVSSSITINLTVK